MKNDSLKICKLNTKNEAAECAKIMSQSDPWLSLQLDYDYCLNIVNEVIGELKDYVVKGYSEILLRKTIGPIADFNTG